MKLKKTTLLVCLLLAISIFSQTKSGTGFAISSNGYIATNYHVVENASLIHVKGIKGNFTKSMTAKIVVVDKNNDLAIIQIDDPSFTSLGTIPYTFKNSFANVGEDVFALGYPLTEIMGDEIKLTNGIVSSKTGIQGDVTMYQVSTPIQPGNSGGPLFDKNGNVIGVITASINRRLNLTENVNYAIKINYLKNLIDVLPTKINLLQNNILNGKSLSDQAKLAGAYTYQILILDTSTTSTLNTDNCFEYGEIIWASKNYGAKDFKDKGTLVTKYGNVDEICPEGWRLPDFYDVEKLKHGISIGEIKASYSDNSLFLSTEKDTLVLPLFQVVKNDQSIFEYGWYVIKNINKSNTLMPVYIRTFIGEPKFYLTMMDFFRNWSTLDYGVFMGVELDQFMVRCVCSK